MSQTTEEPSPQSASWILRVASAAQRITSVPNIFSWLPGFAPNEGRTESPARSNSSSSLSRPRSDSSKAEEPDLSIVREETRALEVTLSEPANPPTSENPSPLKDMKRCDTYRLVRKRQSFVRKDFDTSTSGPDRPITLPGTIVTESEINEKSDSTPPAVNEEDTVFLQQNGDKSIRSGEPAVELPPLPPAQTNNTDVNEQDCYGTLIILGYRDVLFNDVTGDEVPLSKMNEEFVLMKRQIANGIRPTNKDRDQSRNNNFLSEKRITPNLPSGSYTITMTIGGKSSYQQSVKIPFEPDEDSDLFQFGRKENCGNDWQISGKHYDNGCGPVSRYAFRILADRNTREVSVAAGGFDEQGDLFLNHRTIRWGSPPHDAFTTYGLLLRHPGGNWNEVSVLGNMYYLRPSQDIGGLPNNTETNTLKDGSMISVGGTTILYRKGTRRETTQSLMIDQLKTMQRRHLICPVEMSTIHFVREGGPGSVINVQPVEAPLIFPSCGHVFNPNPVIHSRTICPCCREEGVSTNLSFVHHSGICENQEHSPTTCQPTYVFNPCGHATTEEVVRQWGDLPIPGMGDHIAGEWMTQPRSACPYCGNTLSTTRPYCRIYYP